MLLGNLPEYSWAIQAIVNLVTHSLCRYALRCTIRPTSGVLIYFAWPFTVVHVSCTSPWCINLKIHSIMQYLSFSETLNDIGLLKLWLVSSNLVYQSHYHLKTVSKSIIFIQQECLKLFKGDCKDVYIVTNLFQVNPALLNFLFIEDRKII